MKKSQKSGVISIVLVTLMVFSFAVRSANSQGALVGKAAAAVAEGMLGEAGSKLFKLIFGGDDTPEAIDYDKITGIMKSELSVNDYNLAVGNYNEHLNNIRDRFKNFNSEWNSKAVDRQALARNIKNDLDLLDKDANDLIGNYPVQGVYLYGAIQTLRLAIFASMAQERAVASGFTFKNLQRESYRVQKRLAKVDFRRKRLEYIKCDGGNVFDTFIPKKKISSGNALCESIAELLRWNEPVIKRHPQYVGSRMGNRFSHYTYSIEVAGNSFADCGDSSATCNGIKNHVAAIKNDANKRSNFAATVIREWQNLIFAAKAKERIPSTTLAGERIKNFELVNRTGHAIEVGWHTYEGFILTDKPVPQAWKNGGTVPNGGSWSPSHWFYTSSDWFGIYVQDPNEIDGTRLIANFKMWNQEQGQQMIVRSIDPEAIAERSVVWLKDPVDIRYTIKDYIMQLQSDGTKTYSLPLPLSVCRKKCEDEASCKMIRVRRKTEGQDCLMGSSIGVISNTNDDRNMTSWRLVTRQGPYVLERSN